MHLIPDDYRVYNGLIPKMLDKNLIRRISLDEVLHILS